MAKHIEAAPSTEQAAQEFAHPQWFRIFRFLLALAWIVFQFYILFYPLVPMLQRPLHVAFAVSLVFLFKPLVGKGVRRYVFLCVDLVCSLIGLGVGIYFVFHADRIQSRIVFFDEIFPLDRVLCILLVFLLIEATRRTVGYSLLVVVVVFLLYGWFGYLFPGWAYFGGIKLDEYVELLFLGDSGIFGIPVATSLHYVFYFVIFGAIYSAIGGSKLLVELGLRLTRKQKGGAAKAAVIASSLMGTVSGSAVANVTTTGVFTIPLMRQSGYRAETAGAVEAIASTGGQLMPPIMGIGAFVMAELLGIPYLRVALAAVLPALLFYLSLFLLVDFIARRRGIGTFETEDTLQIKDLGKRIHLFLPLLVVVFYIVRGYSPTMAATWGCVAALLVSFIRRETRLNLAKTAKIITSTGHQAASVAIPIAAIGIIIGVAIQSNLALKFSSKIMVISGGSLVISLFVIIIGCVILGMGLPTVAAYIMGAVFFAPPLVKFGIEPLAAHFFVFYYSILAMVTPPVALASFTAAGLAESNVTKTGVRAFLMSFVAFMIPFVFIFRPALLWEGSLQNILIIAVLSTAGVVLWAAAIAGYIGERLSLPVRIFLAVLAMFILLPTGRIPTILAILIAVLTIVLNHRLISRRKQTS